MKYTFTITTPDTEGNGARLREKIVLESRAGESPRHIALKILAYVLFKGEADPLPLRIEQGVGQRHKPDLVASDPETGSVLLWVDCGQIEVQRLGRIVAQNRRAQVVVVKTTENEVRHYARAAAKFLPEASERRAALRFVGFGEEFLPTFLTHMRGTNDLAASREPDTLSVEINGIALTTRLTLFTGN